MHHSSRPVTLLGLLLRAAALRRAWLGGALALLAVGVFFLFRTAGCGRTSAALVATFNIENYPKSAMQEQGAFQAIRALGSKAIALQEITDPVGFCQAAQRQLGRSWDCAFTDRPRQRVGLVYDRSAFELLSTVTHPQTELYDGAKPVLETRLRPLAGGVALRMFILHFRAGGERDRVAMRARQLDALSPVVARAMRSGERVMVLGDFNATSPADVERIALFARSVKLRFASKRVPCTAYWSRSDGCLGVSLDQVLTSFAADVREEGPCRTEGCEIRPACPVFREVVSDHCPVTVSF